MCACSPCSITAPNTPNQYGPNLSSGSASTIGYVSPCSISAQSCACRKATSGAGTEESEVKGRIVARDVPSFRVTCAGGREWAEGLMVWRIGGDVGSSSIAGMVGGGFGWQAGGCGRGGWGREDGAN